MSPTSMERFSEKYQANLVLLEEALQKVKNEERGSESDLFNRVLFCLKNNSLNPLTNESLSFSDIFPPTNNSVAQEARSLLYLTALKTQLPESILTQSEKLAEPSSETSHRLISELGDELGKAMAQNETTSPLLTNPILPDSAPKWAQASLKNPILVYQGASPIEIVELQGHHQGVPCLKTMQGTSLYANQVTLTPVFTELLSSLSLESETLESLPEEEEPLPEKEKSLPKKEESVPEKREDRTPRLANTSEQTPSQDSLRVQNIVEKWYASQIGLEIESLPLEKKFALQGLPSSDDLEPSKKRLCKQAAKIAGALAATALFPFAPILIIGVILSRKIFIEYTRAPEKREKKFKAQYGEEFDPLKDPWSQAIADEIKQQGINLAPHFQKKGEPCETLVILGGCSNHTKSWETEHLAIKKLAAKGFQLVSLTTPKDLSKVNIESLVDFRTLTEKTPPQKLFDSALQFIQESQLKNPSNPPNLPSSDWAITLARVSLANQLNLKIAFNGGTAQRALELDTKMETLIKTEALKSKKTGTDTISNVYGGPIQAANIEMARRELALEKTKDTVKSLLKYEDVKCIHICPNDQSFPLQDAWAALTRLRPLALQIVSNTSNYPWDVWGKTDPVNSSHATSLSRETVNKVIGELLPIKILGGSLPVPVPHQASPAMA